MGRTGEGFGHPGTGDDGVTVRREDLDALIARVAQLEARLDPAGATSESSPDHQEPSGRVGRRAAMKMAGAAGVGAAVTALTATPAAAANGDPVVMGQTSNSATAPTGIAVSGRNRAYGFGVTDNGLATVPSDRPAVLAHTKGNAFSTAIVAMAEGPQVAGRFTSVGAFGTIESVNTGPANTEYDTPALLLRADHGPQLQISPNSGSPIDGQTRRTFPGAIRHASDGLWMSFGSTLNPTWRKIVGPTTAGSLHLLTTPFRAYDSRPGTLPNLGSKTPLRGGTTRTLGMRAGNSPLPPGITGVVVTILLVNAAAGAGNFTIWSAGVPKPLSNTMV